MVLRTLVALAMLAPLLLFGEGVRSDQNLRFAVYKPTKKQFVYDAKSCYITNKMLETAYANPNGSPVNAFLFAFANDFVYLDGGARVLSAYQIGSVSREVNDHDPLLYYYDFLIRTNRLELLLKENTPSKCGRAKAQCAYYLLIAKHLAGKPITDAECKNAMPFVPMQVNTKRICGK